MSPNPDPPSSSSELDSLTEDAPAAASRPARTSRLRGLARRAAIDTRPLSHAAFRRLWLGQAVSFTGFQLTSVAISVQVYTLTKSSLWVGLLGPANLVPLIVFGLWGGAVADAMDRRRLLVLASLVTWASTLGLFLQALLHVGNVPLIIGLVVVQSVGFAITSPTRGAVIPRLLPVTLVPAANTLNFTASQTATFIGPVLAGVVIGSGRYALAYGLDAALFTVGLYAAIRLPAMPPLGDETGRRPGLRSVFEGLRFLGTRPVLMMSFVVDIIAMGVAMPRALFPEVADTRFGGEQAVGWLVAAIAVGAVLGGLMSGWIGRIRRQGIALIAVIAAWGLAVAAAGLAHALWLALLFLALGGAADLVSAVFRQTILQTYAPDEMRGRLQGVFTVVVAGGPRLGDLRAGAVGAAAGATASWVGGGLACAILVVLVGLAVPSFLRYTTDG
ncbi:MFS transporter [Actinoallomurus spadix]|uniref:MFS transporter n=1 Tax=Actinoallomurus spadix TaxID=79912 RepID=A0ABP3HED2_9ACTN|nr:MFS transporter [Actinoallomurus spadix]MCO5985265.1 MFS transporter [Actinoallomurus spadix]